MENLEKRLINNLNDKNIYLLYQVYKYINYVCDYGHIAIFSSILDIDLNEVKLGLKIINDTIITKLLEEAIMINNEQNSNEIIYYSNMISDYEAINNKIYSQKNDILNKIIGFLEDNII